MFSLGPGFESLWASGTVLTRDYNDSRIYIWKGLLFSALFVCVRGKLFIFSIVYVCVCGIYVVCMPQHLCDVRGELCRISFLLLPFHGFQGLNSGWQMSLVSSFICWAISALIIIIITTTVINIIIHRVGRGMHSDQESVLPPCALGI